MRSSIPDFNENLKSGLPEAWQCSPIDRIIEPSMQRSAKNILIAGAF